MSFLVVDSVVFVSVMSVIAFPVRVWRRGRVVQTKHRVGDADRPLEVRQIHEFTGLPQPETSRRTGLRDHVVHQTLCLHAIPFVTVGIADGYQGVDHAASSMAHAVVVPIRVPKQRRDICLVWERPSVFILEETFAVRAGSGRQLIACPEHADLPTAPFAGVLLFRTASSSVRFPPKHSGEFGEFAIPRRRVELPERHGHAFQSVRGTGWIRHVIGFVGVPLGFGKRTDDGSPQPAGLFHYAHVMEYVVQPQIQHDRTAAPVR